MSELTSVIETIARLELTTPTEVCVRMGYSPSYFTNTKRLKGNKPHIRLLRRLKEFFGSYVIVEEFLVKHKFRIDNELPLTKKKLNQTTLYDLRKYVRDAANKPLHIYLSVVLRSEFGILQNFSVVIKREEEYNFLEDYLEELWQLYCGLYYTPVLHLTLMELENENA